MLGLPRERTSRAAVKREVTLDAFQMLALKCIYIYEGVVTPAGWTCCPVPEG